MVLVLACLAAPASAAAQQTGAPRRDDGRAIALTLASAASIANALALAGMGIYAVAVGPSCRQMDGATCARIATPDDALRIEGGVALGASAFLLVVGVYVATLLDAEWNPRPARGQAGLAPWFSVDTQHAAGGVVIRW